MRSETPQLPVDPQPYYVEENDKRYSDAELVATIDDSESGGIVWNLYQFKPREGYEQRADRYNYS